MADNRSLNLDELYRPEYRAVLAEMARRHGVDVGYVRSDIPRMPLAEVGFDAVFCISAMIRSDEHGDSD